ncbi:MAG: HlyC/CorC family transporter [Gammaproteobacteria bacterium]|nr:MAG: HlyC/CorC family transporter [Gammaproteobacteria bacterium]
MNRGDDYHSTNGGAPASPKSLLERLSQALLGEPSNRKELIEILRDATERDLLTTEGLDMIEGVMQVSEMQVREVMIPRAQMDVVDKNQTPDEYLPHVVETAHSRFPMIDGDKDKVIGILLAKDLLRFYLYKESENERFDIDDVLRPAVFVPESKRLNVLLREFRTSRNHMAIVVDEYGGVAGLVTIEDVLEQIVGEIEDEHDIDEDDSMIMRRNDDSHIVKALTPIEDFNNYFKTRYSDEDVETIGGIIMRSLGHLPERGEKCEIGDLEFEILRADSRRVHLLKVQPITEADKKIAK